MSRICTLEGPFNYTDTATAAKLSALFEVNDRLGQMVYGGRWPLVKRAACVIATDAIDSPFLFQIHVVQQLTAHLPLAHRLALFQQPVRQSLHRQIVLLHKVLLPDSFAQIITNACSIKAQKIETGKKYFPALSYKQKIPFRNKTERGLFNHQNCIYTNAAAPKAGPQTP